MRSLALRASSTTSTNKTRWRSPPGSGAARCAGPSVFYVTRSHGRIATTRVALTRAVRFQVKILEKCGDEGTRTPDLLHAN